MAYILILDSDNGSAEVDFSGDVFLTGPKDVLSDFFELGFKALNDGHKRARLELPGLRISTNFTVSGKIGEKPK